MGCIVSREHITMRHLAQNLAQSKCSVTSSCHGSVPIGARWWSRRAGGLAVSLSSPFWNPWSACLPNPRPHIPFLCRRL